MVEVPPDRALLCESANCVEWGALFNFRSLSTGAHLGVWPFLVLCCLLYWRGLKIIPSSIWTEQNRTVFSCLEFKQYYLVLEQGICPDGDNDGFFLPGFERGVQLRWGLDAAELAVLRLSKGTLLFPFLLSRHYADGRNSHCHRLAIDFTSVELFMTKL